MFRDLNLYCALTGGGGLAIGGLVTGYIGTVITSLAVLGMLAAIAIPAFVSARDKAQHVHGLANLSQIGKICVMYADSMLALGGK